MAKDPEVLVPVMTDQDREDYGTFKSKIRRGFQSIFDVAYSMKQIKDRELWREEYGSFDEFLEQEYGITRRRCNQLVQMAALGETAKDLSERAARELVGVPEKKREAVLDLAREATDGKPTAKAVKEARAQIELEQESEPEVEVEVETEETEPEPPAAPTDRTGREIPEQLAEVFAQTRKFMDIVQLLQQAKQKAKQLSDHRAGVHLPIQSITTEIKNALGSVRSARPWRICTCKTSKGCRSCKGQRFLSEAQYKRLPEDLR